MGKEIKNYVFAYQDLVLNSVPIQEGIIEAIDSDYETIEHELHNFQDITFPILSSYREPSPEELLSKLQKENRDDYFEILGQVINDESNYLQSEGIDIPTEQTVNLTKQLLTILAVDNIYPSRIGSSVEEGLCLTFKNHSQVMYFEIYNDGEIGYLIEDTGSKEVLQNYEVNSISEGRSAINEFFDLACNFQGV